MNRIRYIAILLASLFLASVEPALATRMAEPQRLQILVPAYFYPGSTDRFWPAMTQAARRVPITAILNPGSGPGKRADANYQQAVKSFRRAGGRIIAYLHTEYGMRQIDRVTDEIRRYTRFYQVDGFFIDEMSSQASDRSLNYYRQLYRTIKQINPGFVVIGNPGTNSDARFLDQGAADTLINFESPRPSHTQHRIDDWVERYSSSRFGQLVYRAESVQAMQQAITRAMSQNAGFVYVTDDTLINPWDTLPTYWTAQIRCVERINSGRVCAQRKP